MIYGRIVTFIALILFIASPLVASAQTAPQTQQFNPNASLNFNGNSFSGVNFSGVGGAIASCVNAGGSIGKVLDSATSSIGSLFSSSSSSSIAGSNTAPSSSGSTPAPSSTQQAAQTTGASSVAGQEVPVNDSKIKETNKKLDLANKRENCLNGVAYAVAKSMLQQVTNKTLSWVNTGLNGNPLYVRNIGSYLKTVQDQRITNYLDRVSKTNPVFGNAIRSIITEQVTGVTDGLLDKAMNTPEGRAYQDFQDDFVNGGWNAYLDPNNNALDAIFNAGDELGRSISSDQDEIQSQLERNNGFLDVQRCVEYGKPNVGASQTPNDQNCVRWETVTPGSVISAQINEITTSPIRQLEQADQINEVLGSFFDQLLNRLFSQGLAALRGKNSGLTFSGGGLGSNVTLGTNGQPINSMGNLGLQTGASGIATNDFDVSHPQQLKPILQAQYNYLNHALDSKVTMERIIPVLGALDYCIPGPNPTWQNGLQDNVDTYLGSLQEVQKGTPLAQQIVQQLPVVGGFLSGLVGAFTANRDHVFAAANVQLFDKAIDAPVSISNTVFKEKVVLPEVIPTDVRSYLVSVMNTYKNTYTKDAVKNVFLTIDPGNASYVNGFIETSFTETSKLPQYDRGIAELEDQYTTSIQDTRNAIAELEDIRQEANQIVATAKARYIAQQAAAGTPVNQTCIDQAYVIDNSAITPTPRLESDTPSPYRAQSMQAATYFYSHL